MDNAPTYHGRAVSFRRYRLNYNRVFPYPKALVVQGDMCRPGSWVDGDLLTEEDRCIVCIV